MNKKTRKGRHLTHPDNFDGFIYLSLPIKETSPDHCMTDRTFSLSKNTVLQKEKGKDLTRKNRSRSPQSPFVQYHTFSSLSERLMREGSTLRFQMMKKKV